MINQTNSIVVFLYLIACCLTQYQHKVVFETNSNQSIRFLGRSKDGHIMYTQNVTNRKILVYQYNKGIFRMAYSADCQVVFGYTALSDDGKKLIGQCSSTYKCQEFKIYVYELNSTHLFLKSEVDLDEKNKYIKALQLSGDGSLMAVIQSNQSFMSVFRNQQLIYSKKIVYNFTPYYELNPPQSVQISDDLNSIVVYSRSEILIYSFDGESKFNQKSLFYDLFGSGQISSLKILSYSGDEHLLILQPNSISIFKKLNDQKWTKISLTQLFGEKQPYKKVAVSNNYSMICLCNNYSVFIYKYSEIKRNFEILHKIRLSGQLQGFKIWLGQDGNQITLQSSHKSYRSNYSTYSTYSTVSYRINQLRANNSGNGGNNVQDINSDNNTWIAFVVGAIGLLFAFIIAIGCVLCCRCTSTNNRVNKQDLQEPIDSNDNLQNKQQLSDTLRKTVCSICLQNDVTSKINCGHTFHYECIKSWIKRQSICPNCRVRINQSEIVVLL